MRSAGRKRRTSPSRLFPDLRQPWSEAPSHPLASPPRLSGQRSRNAHKNLCHVLAAGSAPGSSTLPGPVKPEARPLGQLRRGPPANPRAPHRRQRDAPPGPGIPNPHPAPSRTSPLGPNAPSSNSLRKLVQPLRHQPRQSLQGGLRAVRVGGEDDLFAALDAEAEDGQHRGGVDRGGVRLGDGDGDAGGGGGPDEDGSGTGVQALGPADVDAALSHVEAALHETDDVV